MMSDDNRVWTKWNREEQQLNKLCKELSHEQKLEVFKGLTDQGKENKFGKALALYVSTLPKAKSFRSTVMSAAHYYMSKGIYSTFSECLRAAWKAYRVRKALKSGVVSFIYRKATGAIREATGTLNTSLYTFTGKGVRKEPQPDAIKYYDLEKDAWRMFRIERLIKVA